MQSKKHDGHKDVEEIKDSKKKHEVMERLLNKVLGEDVIYRIIVYTE
jgi:hypothetical protein